MLEIMEMLSILKDKEVNVYAVKGGWELNGSLQSKIMAIVFSIASDNKLYRYQYGTPPNFYSEQQVLFNQTDTRS